MLCLVKRKSAQVIALLRLVTPSKAEQALDHYLTDENRQLFLYNESSEADAIAGCIGVLRLSPKHVEITHIAVANAYRRRGIASNMIAAVCEITGCTEISAETDTDAVGFYRSYGFEVRSLGEKYPNVERFECQLEI